MNWLDFVEFQEGTLPTNWHSTLHHIKIHRQKVLATENVQNIFLGLSLSANQLISKHMLCVLT